MAKTDGKELKEKLFANRKNGWENLTDEEFCTQARQKGININALSDYYFMAPPSEHRFVINYSSLLDKDIEPAINRLSEIINI